MKNTLLFIVCSFLISSNGLGQAYVIFGDPGGMCNQTGICKSTKDFANGTTKVFGMLTYPTDVFFTSTELGGTKFKIQMSINLSNLYNFQPMQIGYFSSLSYTFITGCTISKNVSGLNFDLVIPDNHKIVTALPPDPPYSQNPAAPTYYTITLGSYDSETGKLTPMKRKRR